MACSLQSDSYKLHLLIQKDNNDEIDKFIDTIKDKQFSRKEARGITSLILKYYLKTQQLENAKHILDVTEGLMKRDYLNYIQSIYDIDRQKAISCFYSNVVNYELIIKDIDFIIKHHMKDLLIGLDGYYFKTSLKFNTFDVSNLKVYPINSIKLQPTIDKIKTIIPSDSCDKLTTKITNNYNVIIDGCNVIFAHKGKLGIQGYMGLLQMIKTAIKQFGNPLLIIHRRHFSKNKFKGQIASIINTLLTDFKDNLFLTPYHHNDDWFILLASLTLRVPIITNDKFRDHIFKYDFKFPNEQYLRYILDFLSLNFVFNHKNLIISYLPKISNCIQVINDDVYIPSTNGLFYLL